jgi:hypothetical protein
MRAHLVLPDELVKEVDNLVGKRNRSRFIVEAARERLRRERLSKAIREGAGILDPKKYPHWSTPDKIDSWVRELRETPSSYDKRIARDRKRGGVSPRHKRAG